MALAALARRLHQPFLHTSLVGLLADYLPHRKEVFSRPALHRFFVVNRDIFLRTLCMVAVNASFTSFGGRQGALVLSANTLLLMFFTFSLTSWTVSPLLARRYAANTMELAK